MLAGIMHRFAMIALPAFERVSAQSWRVLPLPSQSRIVARGAGHDPDRVLLAGGSSAVGWGVVSHDLALAGHLARMTATLTTRGTDVEVIADARMSVAQLQKLLTPEVIARYDAIVLTLGTRESFSLMPDSMWSTQLTGLLDHIAAEKHVQPAVIIVGAEEQPPVPLARWVSSLVVGRAQALNAVTRAITADRDRVHYLDSAMVPLEEDHGSLVETSKSALYERCAAVIAPTLAELLDSATDRVSHPIDEAARVKAIEFLQQRSDRSDSRLNELLDMVKHVLHVRSADLFLVDRDTVRLLAATSGTPDSRPRAESLSSLALVSRGLVIPDLSAEEAHRDRPEVAGPPYLRFYAAHPIESPEGHRVGVLAVVDTEARTLSPSELSLLRLFALRVGTLLFEHY